MNESTRPEVDFQSPAKVTAKKMGVAPQGVLTLAGGRLRFAVGDRVDLDVPVTSVTDVVAPWYMMGAGFRFVVDGKRWVADFSKLTPLGGHSVVGAVITAAQFTGLGDWRQLARTWREVLVRAGASAR